VPPVRSARDRDRTRPPGSSASKRSLARATVPGRVSRALPAERTTDGRYAMGSTCCGRRTRVQCPRSGDRRGRAAGVAPRGDGRDLLKGNRLPAAWCPARRRCCQGEERQEPMAIVIRCDIGTRRAAASAGTQIDVAP
jgi:hypothetical protein